MNSTNSLDCAIGTIQAAIDASPLAGPIDALLLISIPAQPASLGMVQGELARHFPRGEALFPIGDDLFAILCRQLPSPRAAKLVARDVNADIERGLSAADEKPTASPSIGVSLSPNDGVTAKALLTAAQQALDYAQDMGGGLVKFAPTLDAISRQHDRLLSDLHAAAARDELTVHFQPVQRLDTGQVEFQEALLRWRRPNAATPDTATFVRLAEKNLASDRLHRFVVQAIRDIQARHGADLAPISLNLSPEQVATDSAVDGLLAAFDTRERRASIVLEVTEHTRFRDMRQFERLEELRANGFRLAIDDFGKNFANMDYLARIPADYLKIDAEFLRHCGSARWDTIFRSMIDLAHALDMQVVAEGVETQGQLDFLHKTGCDLAQGYLLGKPGPL
ncbi:GGDEF domain-containing phosphodiesterase [Rhodovulum adriaticum]|uniref:EAL domain-containing protein (Putative c-di-GMP-specific phosphodiesterase class I) n=1 Tax=Rhodovulum adriaticum TaxID=35804 RepID=A0A4V2SL81_RHOAD|nr:GGDEF domain-containing phosphodiesterase [Rhodovulum adriaticum]MBK1636005.1 hypothetical protein [Rhodovulum adriaticum]TCP22436.1 EAL domain-containing protein (putative c-di-GMP-specific phosphodiesterase class I) [Rhodovulum adriaticum]